jgi:peptide/nickel transport system substrate-binding protein
MLSKSTPAVVCLLELRIVTETDHHGKVKMSRLILVLLITAITACSPASQENTVAANRIVYGLTLSPSGFDPHVNESSEIGIVLRQVYDTLVYRDPATNQFTAGLATEWTLSQDQLIYTFKLRQDVKFHDGTEFTAQTVADNLDRITNPETKSQKALALLGTYQRHEITDRYVINIILSEPFAPLLDSFSQVYLGMASPTAFRQYPVERYQFHQVGTGPFRLIDFIPDNRLVLKRNPDYQWAPSFYKIPAEGGIEEIEYRFFGDVATRLTGLESGTAQIMGEIPPSDARSLTGNSQIRIIRTGIPGQPLQFLMNTRTFPTDNTVMRQALIYATNRTAITDVVFQGFSPTAWGPLSRQTLYYSRDVENRYAYDQNQARALLASLGYSDNDNNGYLDAGSGNLQVTIIVPPWGSIPLVAQLLQDQWREVGVEAVLKLVPDFPSLLEAIRNSPYNLVAFYSFGLDPVFLSSYFMTDASRNWTGFSSAGLDTILRDAARRTESNVRRDLYAQAQRIIMDEALILPIRDYVNLNGASATIQGLTFDAYGWFPLMANVFQTGE